MHSLESTIQDVLPKHEVPALCYLAVEQRECKDARSLGDLFYLSVDELPDVCFVEAMRLLLLLFVERLQEKPMLDEGETGQLQGFLKDLPVLLSQKLRKCA